MKFEFNGEKCHDLLLSDSRRFLIILGRKIESRSPNLSLGLSLLRWLKTYESGVRRLLYCLVMDGVKIRNAKEWKAYNTPSGFTAGQVHYLKRLLEAPSL